MFPITSRTLSNLFSTEEADLTAFMRTEFKRDYERAKKEGQNINKKFVRKFLRGQGIDF